MYYTKTVIIKGDLNDSYDNNTTCMDFSMHDTVINAIIEVSNWSIIENGFPSG